MKILKVIMCFFMLATALNAQQGNTGVYINGVELQTQVVHALEQYYKVKVKKGRYWYDAKCGLWGLEGREAQGVVLANLDFGASMNAKASSGNTGIYINGRQINNSERTQWQAILGQTYPGKYMLDAYGNLYTEAGAYLVNVLQLIRNKAPYNDGNGNYFYRNYYTDITTGGNGDGFYIMGDGWSYSSF